MFKFKKNCTQCYVALSNILINLYEDVYLLLTKTRKLTRRLASYEAY